MAPIGVNPTRLIVVARAPVRALSLVSADFGGELRLMHG